MTFPVGDYIRWNTHPVSKYARDLAFWARKNRQGVPTIRLNRGDYLSYAEVYRRAMQGMWQAHVDPVCAGVKIRSKNPTPYCAAGHTVYYVSRSKETRQMTRIEAATVFAAPNAFAEVFPGISISKLERNRSGKVAARPFKVFCNGAVMGALESFDAAYEKAQGLVV